MLIPANRMYVPRNRGVVGRAASGDVPTSFDSRQQWPHCVGQIRNQASCGSCWAFSAVGEFGERRCIAGLDAQRVQYSEEYPVACDQHDNGCNGGTQPFVHSFLKHTGTTTDKCVSYKSGDGVTKACPTKCDDGSGIKLTKAANWWLSEFNVDHWYEQIQHGGPV